MTIRALDYTAPVDVEFTRLSQCAADRRPREPSGRQPSTTTGSVLLDGCRRATASIPAQRRPGDGYWREAPPDARLFRRDRTHCESMPARPAGSVSLHVGEPGRARALRRRVRAVAYERQVVLRVGPDDGFPCCARPWPNALQQIRLEARELLESLGIRRPDAACWTRQGSGGGRREAPGVRSARPAEVRTSRQRPIDDGPTADGAVSARRSLAERAPGAGGLAPRRPGQFASAARASPCGGRAGRAGEHAGERSRPGHSSTPTRSGFGDCSVADLRLRRAHGRSAARPRRFRQHGLAEARRHPRT